MLIATPGTRPVLRHLMLRTALLTLLLALVAAAPAGAADPRHRLGDAADGALLERPADHGGDWPLIASSGAATVRVAFYWDQGQPLGPGAVDLSCE